MVLFKKKADIELSLTTIVVAVITIIVLLALFYVTAKLVGIFIGEKDESTIRNFEMLATTIIQLDDGISVTNYPIFISDDYAVVGYQTDVPAIGGICPIYDMTSPYLNKKPEQCGTGDEGCLCLCEKTKEFAALCQENEKVIACKKSVDFDAVLSFIGGIFSDKSGRCDFALIYGNDQPQTIYIKKVREEVRICSKECEHSE